MTKNDFQIHADLIHRAYERAVKATDHQNPVTLMVLQMLEDEYRAADQIMPVDDPPVPGTTTVTITKTPGAV